MNNYLDSLVTLVNNMDFEIDEVVPLGLLWWLFWKLATFAVVIETWDFLRFEVSEIAFLLLVSHKIEGLNVFASRVFGSVLYNFVQLTKHAEEALRVNLLFDYYEGSFWLYIGAVSDS